MKEGKDSESEQSESEEQEPLNTTYQPMGQEENTNGAHLWNFDMESEGEKEDGGDDV